jgi:ribosomal protein L19
MPFERLYERFFGFVISRENGKNRDAIIKSKIIEFVGTEYTTILYIFIL